MATLSPRQTHFYVHRCDIWKNVPQYGADDVQTGERWEVVSVGVPCFFSMSPNADETGHGFGRIQFDSLMTMDTVLFGKDQEVDSDYILSNRTLDADGSHSANYGSFWRVRGPARDFSDANSRRAGRKSVYAYREKTPPIGVS